MTLFTPFFHAIQNTSLSKYEAHFAEHIQTQFSEQRHGELRGWLEALASMPNIHTDEVDLKNAVKLSTNTSLSDEQQNRLDTCLRQLIPWRKGPFEIFSSYIDTEWRSDWKWDRLIPHIDSLEGKKVLDIGCGSGYHCWRMIGEGADWVLGIDPSPRFVVQFEMLKHYMPEKNVQVVPLGIEHLPERINFFDTTFSMGVLYHRTSPIDHLKELRDTLRPGGQLVLETLVIDGELGQVLVPDDRYAMMRNVWFIPSVPSLMQWLSRCGFEDIQCVDVNTTSLDEQRSTEWMPSHSLKEFLDPNDQNLSAEGYPAPKRAVIVAKRKGG